VTAVRLQIPTPMGAFLQPYRHKIARGGRGSSKSWSIARLLVAQATASRKRWLCCREVQKSIKESSHRLIASQIDAMGLSSLYDVQRDVIRGPHGSEFIFAGLRDHTADSLKSLEDLDGAWVEEAHTVSDESANILIPTVRNAGSEIWWSYNPDQEADYVHVMAESGAPDVLVVNLNWDGNPWFPAELNAERLKLKALNDDLYQHVWEGKCRSAAGLLFKRTWFKFYDKLPERLSVYMASDYAVTPEDTGDFTEHGVGGLDENGDLYLMDWYFGQEAPETWIEAAIALIRRHKPQIWFEEAGVIARALEGSLNKRLREDQIYILRETLPSASSKAARALGFAARASAGTIYLPRNEPWAVRLLNQLCAFNGEPGRVDDGVDVCSLMARGLEMMIDARPAPAAKKPPPAPFTDAYFAAMDREDDDTAQKRATYYR
jgi:predicted phage terminase large subunit-like protein